VLGSHPLPVPDATGHESKEWVSARPCYASKTAKSSGIASVEFPPQMFPLEEQLTPRLKEPAREPTVRHLPGVERITSFDRLSQNAGEVGSDRPRRVRRRPEPEELGVMAVTPGRPSQDFLSQEPFPPNRNESPGVEITGMECPEPHVRYLRMKSTIFRFTTPAPGLGPHVEVSRPRARPAHPRHSIDGPGVLQVVDTPSVHSSSAVMRCFQTTEAPVQHRT
jgi:hypothetical protein